MPPDAVAAEQRDVGNVADVVPRIAEDTLLPGRLRVSRAVGVLDVGIALVAGSGIAATRSAAAGNRTQKARAGRAVAESIRAGRRAEPLDVIYEVAGARIIPRNLWNIGLGRAEVCVIR